MITESDKSVVREKIAKLTNHIERQAIEVVERNCAERMEQLETALKKFDVEAVPTVRFVEVWEDSNGQLPPKACTVLQIKGNGKDLLHRFDVPVSPLWIAGKPDHIFEMCMLRAELHMELVGTCDGQTLQRVAGLEQEMGI